MRYTFAYCSYMPIKKNISFPSRFSGTHNRLIIKITFSFGQFKAIIKSWKTYCNYCIRNIFVLNYIITLLIFQKWCRISAKQGCGAGALFLVPEPPKPILSNRLRSRRQAPAPDSGTPEFKSGSGSEMKALRFLFKKHVFFWKNMFLQMKNMFFFVIKNTTDQM